MLNTPSQPPRPSRRTALRATALAMTVAVVLPMTSARAATSLRVSQGTNLLTTETVSGAEYGRAAALSGDTAVVGAPGDRNSAGAVYVFVRSGAGWIQQARLTASDGGSLQYFGDAVALSGDTLLVGADGIYNQSGGVYVFVRSGSAWTQQAKLTGQSAPGERFGQSVALSGDTALVGAPGNDGAAYMFTRSGSTWAQQAKVGGLALKSFGTSVALSGDTALVGEPLSSYSTAEYDAGDAYVFSRSGSTWTYLYQIVAPEGTAGDRFGQAVALSGTTALVGAAFDDDNAEDSGSAYIFSLSTSAGTEQAKLHASDPAFRDYFGQTVALAGDAALIGAPFKDNFVGSAYVFSGSGSTWAQQAKLTHPGGAVQEQFGSSLGLSTDGALVGGPAPSSFTPRTGSAIEYSLERTAPPPAPVTPSPPPPPPPSPAASRSGYWMVGSDGAVYPFGDARGYGNAPAAVDLEPTPSGNGYWIVDATGVVSAFGDAHHLGNADRSKLTNGETATSLSATPTGNGYWIFTTKGRVLPFGDAVSYGDMSAVKLNGPVRGSIPTPSGKGYYMVASDGGIFSFGDAKFYGSMGAKKLNAPVQSLVPTGDATGYWLVASDGGIFAFNAPFRGSMGDKKLNKPITGMVRYGNGYLMVSQDGGIFNFSDKTFSGSLGANPPKNPITSVAVLET